jgi:hypothetical protein
MLEFKTGYMITENLCVAGERELRCVVEMCKRKVQTPPNLILFLQELASFAISIALNPV